MEYALIASLPLPDDPYEAGPAARAVASVLARALAARPAEVDLVVQGALALEADEDVKGALFDTYTSLFRRSRAARDDDLRVTPAHELAIQRIIDVLLSRAGGKVFDAVARFLVEEARGCPVALLERKIESLVGAAALLSNALEDRGPDLIERGPVAPLEALEKSNRRMTTERAIDGIMGCVQRCMRRQPDTVGALILSTLDNLDASHPRLRAKLLGCLGPLAKTPQLSRVLPVLYSALGSKEVIVRRTGVELYAALRGDVPENLPTLLDESIVVCLLDPVVSVHVSAARAVRDHPLGALDEAALSSLLRLAYVYAVGTGRNDQQEAWEVIEATVAVARRTKRLSGELCAWVVDCVSRRVGPWERMEFIRRHGPLFRSAGGYWDLVFGVLDDPPSEHAEDSALEELDHAPASEVALKADQLERVLVGRHVAGGTSLERGMEVLIRTGLWEHAERVAGAHAASFSDSEWDRPQRLRAEAMSAAVRTERAVALGDGGKALEEVTKWKKWREEISDDDEQNRDVRDTFMGVRLPRQES